MNELILIEIGARIRDRRVELGISQDELATLCGFGGRSAVSLVEKGKRNITTERLQLIADALKVKPQYLMGWGNDFNESAYIISSPKSDTQTLIEKKLSNLTEGQLKAILSLVKEMEA